MKRKLNLLSTCCREKEALNVAISDENPKASEEVVKRKNEKVKVSEENKNKK